MKFQVNGTVEVLVIEDSPTAKEAEQRILNALTAPGTGIQSVSLDVAPAPTEVDGQMALPFEA